MVVCSLAVVACEPGQPRAVIAVMFGSPDAVRVAQAVIAETARAGEPVIVLQQDQRFEGSSETAFRRAEWALALPDLVAVVGHESSGSSLAAAPAYRDAGIPIIIPTATTPRLGALEGAFPVAANDSVQGAFLAQFAVQRLGAGRPIVFYVSDEYGYGLHEGVAREFDRLGVALLEGVPITRASNVEAMVEASFARDEPDVVIVAGRSPEAWLVAKAVHDRNPAVGMLAGDGAYAVPVPYHLAGPAADSVYLSVYWHPDAADSAGRAFIERFHTLTNREPGPADAMVYDAIMLTVRAIRTAGANPARVTRFLETVGSLSPSFQGVTGTIDFLGRPRPVYLIRAQDGTTRLVEMP